MERDILQGKENMEEKYPQEDLFRRLEERLIQPEVRQSAQSVADLLADDFIEFGSSGRVFNRRQIIDGLQQESPTQRSIIQFKASFLATGVVLATYRAIQDSTSGEPPTYSLRCSIWKMIHGRWQIVFHQGTLASEFG